MSSTSPAFCNLPKHGVEAPADQAGDDCREHPLITIGLTCFNAADTIERAVASAMSQDWPNFEIVVVDDCSRDNSWEILESLSKRTPALRIVRHPANRGFPGALNTILNEARGEFIAFFDDDDESRPDRLSRQWSRISTYERDCADDMVLCYTNRLVVRSRGRGQHIAEAIGRRAQEPRGRAVADYLFGHRYDRSYTWGMFGSCTLMARTSAFRRIGPFDETFRRCAEWDMAVRAAFMGTHFIAVDDALVTQHKTASADKSGTIPLRYSLQLRTKYKSYLKSHGVYRATRAIAYSRFHSAKGRPVLGYGYMLLACLSSPVVLMEKSKAWFTRGPRRQVRAQGI